MPLYFEAGTVKLYHDDFLQFNELPPESVNLIVTSPPYNTGLPYDAHDDEMPYPDYLDFVRKALIKCYELAKPDGRLCLNLPFDITKGPRAGERYCSYVDITTIAKEVGWHYHTTIVWDKRFTQRVTAWGSWASASAPYIVTEAEVIVVMFKERWRRLRKGVSDITPEEFLRWVPGVWRFDGKPESKKQLSHPAPFPLELPERCIKLFSYVGDTVLDPFVGSGTTLIVCLKLGRVGIGVEVSEAYCKLAAERLRRVILPFEAVGNGKQTCLQLPFPSG